MQNLAHSLENEAGNQKRSLLVGCLHVYPLGVHEMWCLKRSQNEAPNEAKIHQKVSFVDPVPNLFNFAGRSYIEHCIGTVEISNPRQSMAICVEHTCLSIHGVLL